MKATGIVRRFDDFGRIVIPKELRGQIFGTAEKSEGKPMEIFMDKDNIVLCKYEENKSDDVCEWKSIRDGEFIQNPHTRRTFSNEPSMQNVYCNTCGKKDKCGGMMKDNMLVFKDNETHTEIRYVIAHFEKSQWYHYLDFPNIEDAKEHLEKVRKIHPNMKFGLFEKIEQATINMLAEEFI